MERGSRLLWFNLVPLAVLPCPKSACSSQPGGSLPEQREGKRGIVLEPPHEPSSFPTAQSQSSARAESACCHAGGMVIFHQKSLKIAEGPGEHHLLLLVSTCLYFHSFQTWLLRYLLWYEPGAGSRRGSEAVQPPGGWGIGSQSLL